MDLYAVLGLSPGASTADVKRAYRRLSRRYHPGINPGDRAAEVLFQRITEAYETLVDHERRRRYEEAAPPASVAGAETTEFTGFDFSAAARGPEAATFSELFADALHPVQYLEGGRPQQGADLHLAVAVTFDESMRGVERTLTVTRHVPCGACRAAGYVLVVEGRCPHCHGSGKVRWARGHMVFTKACAACSGTGRERHQRCATCAGHGRVVRTETLSVRIPAGIVDGTRLRLAGQGHAGTRGARSGDVYVDVGVRPHPMLRRDGDDLHLVLPVAVHEAVLGARIEIPSFDGPVRVRIPPGTQGGHRFRLSGRGAVTLRGERGDLYAEVRLTLPSILDERSKALMREFGRINSSDVRASLAECFRTDE